MTTTEEPVPGTNTREPARREWGKAPVATQEIRFLEGPQTRRHELLGAFRVFCEMIRGVRAFHFLGPCVTVFGSARFPAGHRWYELGRAVGREVAGAGFTVMTGGGPGIMEAANRGAKDVGGRSFGATIDIGREPANRYVDTRVPFHYFFARKVILVKYSYGFVHLPGGFGTLDEMYEALTLMQTDRLREFPVVLYGTEYWGGMVDWIRTTLLAAGAIEQADVDRFLLTDDPVEVVDALLPIARRLDITTR